MNMFAEHPQLHSSPVDVSEYRSWPPPGHRPTRFAACGATEGATGVAGGLVGLGAEGVVLPQFATTNPIRRAKAQLVRLLCMTVRPRCNAGSAQCHQRPRFVQSGAMARGNEGSPAGFRLRFAEDGGIQRAGVLLPPSRTSSSVTTNPRRKTLKGGRR